MLLDSEIKVSLQRIENALQNSMELRDFRNFMLAKSYLEEGQIHTAIQFLNRIDRNTDYNAQLVISQSLFIRALILVFKESIQISRGRESITASAEALSTETKIMVSVKLRF